MTAGVQVSVAEPVVSQPAPFAAAAVAVVVAESSPASRYDQAPSAPSNFETEQVREYPPRQQHVEPQTASAPSAGYAPAKPVEIEWPSDLQQVESDPGKVQAFAEQGSPPAPAAPRPRRARAQPQPIVEEPLVQIETGLTGSQASSSGEKTPA